MSAQTWSKVRGRAARRNAFSFANAMFDRIEVGTVGRQKAELRADGFDGRADLRLLVDREIVEHDDIAGPQRRDQHLLDVGEKARRVDRPIEDGRRREPVQPQRGDRPCGSPNDRRACDRAAACRADCGRSGAADRSSRRIHRERHTGRTSRSGSPSRQWRRSAATSGRRCSSACTVFFDGEIQLIERAPDRRQAGRRPQRLAQSRLERRIRPRRHQRAQAIASARPAPAREISFA